MSVVHGGYTHAENAGFWDERCPNCLRAQRDEARAELARLKSSAPLIPQSRADAMVAEEREAIIKAVDRLDLMQWVKARVAAAIRARKTETPR